MSEGAKPSDSPAESAMRLIDKDIDHHRSLILQWKFERNAESRICQLPTEILCRVFLITRRAYENAGNKPSPHKRLPYQFLWIFVITHVCRHWRTVALNDPALWTFPTLFLYNLGKLMLERARMAGLQIEIDHRDIEPDLMDEVLHHMSHTKKLNILNGYRGGLKKLFAQLPSAAPMLETLIIRYEESRYNLPDSPHDGVTVPKSLFHGVTSLRGLTLQGLSLQDWDSPLFDHITRLSLHDIPQDKMPSLVQFKGMLERMPQLTDLTLDGACPLGEGSQESETTGNRPVYLPNLRSLSIGMSAPQVKAFYSIVAVPPKMGSMKTYFLYRPDINFTDTFSTAKRAHLLDATSLDGLRLEIYQAPRGIAFQVVKDTESSDDDEEDEDSAQILIKSDWVHYSSTREATANQHMFLGIMTGLDWTCLQFLTIHLDHLSPEALRSSVGFLPNLHDILLRGKVAVSFVDALHSGWDIDPVIEPGSLAFARLATISFLQVEFSFDEEDADKDSLGLDLLQDCLMGRYERGAAIELVIIAKCEGICEADVDMLSDIVSGISWDGEEIGFESDDDDEELSE